MSREPEVEVEIAEASERFIGQWNRLISTTNWEKGRIIHEWRSAGVASGAPATEYSDEAWSRLVGGVTGQHVGRLRRVYERFGGVYQDYEGLYWSHFQAALDWDDAEMWLEGALQNSWSVSQVRQQRWQTLGAADGQEPRETDLVVVDPDEDFVSPATGSSDPADAVSRTVPDGEFLAEARSPAGPDFGDEDEPAARGRKEDVATDLPRQDEPDCIPLQRPFENLPPLPEDLAAAFESFQLAILRHKAGGWQETSRDDVLASLDALKTLTLAPSAADA